MVVNKNVPRGGGGGLCKESTSGCKQKVPSRGKKNSVGPSNPWLGGRLGTPRPAVDRSQKRALERVLTAFACPHPRASHPTHSATSPTVSCPAFSCTRRKTSSKCGGRTKAGEGRTPQPPAGCMKEQQRPQRPPSTHTNSPRRGTHAHHPPHHPTATMSVVAKIWDGLRASYTKLVVTELNNYGTSSFPSACIHAREPPSSRPSSPLRTHRPEVPGLVHRGQGRDKGGAPPIT